MLLEQVRLFGIHVLGVGILQRLEHGVDGARAGDALELRRVDGLVVVALQVADDALLQLRRPVDRRRCGAASAVRTGDDDHEPADEHDGDEGEEQGDGAQRQAPPALGTQAAREQHAVDDEGEQEDQEEDYL